MFANIGVEYSSSQMHNRCCISSLFHPRTRICFVVADVLEYSPGDSACGAGGKNNVSVLVTLGTNRGRLAARCNSPIIVNAMAGS